MKPASTEVQERVRASFDRQGLMKHFGAKLESIESGRVVVTMPCSDKVTQQHGYVHAGATGSIADTAGGYAALSMLDANSEVLGVEYKINLLAPAKGDYLEAVGTVIRSGRTLTVCNLEVFAITGSERRLVAQGQQTLIRVDA